MLLPAAREAIVTTCQELSRAGLVVGTAGNVSVRSGDLVAVSPSGLRYAELTPELVGVHRLDGTAVEAPLAPTSELPLHLAIYAARPEVGAIVHTHSPAATALSTLVDEIPSVHYYVAMFGGSGGGGPVCQVWHGRAGPQRGGCAPWSHWVPDGQPRRGHRRG